MMDEPEFFPKEIEKVESNIKLLKKEKREHEEMMTRVAMEETKKHAKEIKSLERRIKWLEKKKKCLELAIEKSIDLLAAQNLVEQQQEEEEAAALKEKTEETMREQQPAEDSSLPPLPFRCRPLPKGCDNDEYLEWVREYKRVLDLNDADYNLPTLNTKHKDPETVSAVVVPDDKRKLLRVADAVVNVSYRKHHPDLNDLNEYITGIIIDWDLTKKRAMILTCNCFDYPESGHKIYVRWQYIEDTVFEAELLFISPHYMIAVLEIAFMEMPVDIPTEIVPSFGSITKSGQEVFALARDKDLSLMVRHGTILYRQESIDELRQGYLFADYEIPECGPGGPVVDQNGDVVGMSFSFEEKGMSVILPIVIARTCVDMWKQFRRVTRPSIGMCLNIVELEDEVSGDTIDEFVVDQVDPDSIAWDHGIRSGNVIASFNGQRPTFLPEFEQFLLSCGMDHLLGNITEVKFKLEVQDASGVRRPITLTVPFYDVAKGFDIHPTR